MLPYEIPFWKQAPFVRILIPACFGIIFQWYLPIQVALIWAILSLFGLLYYFFYRLPFFLRYRFRHVQHFLLCGIIVFVFMLTTEDKNIRNCKIHFENVCREKDLLQIMVDEVPAEKQKSFKSVCKAEMIIHENKATRVSGKILIYFQKDSISQQLHYGDLILINKKPLPLKNAGNPGEFDNKRYLAFQNIYHQLYVKSGEYQVLNKNNASSLWKFIYSIQGFTLRTLQNHIKNNEALGIAEALLIGYKNDLDKETVQSYSNTGVVHIIAISGMHLGLIYMGLLWLFNCTPVVKRHKITKAVLLISCLWVFSLMTGASASVLRSAVMFTCIIIGNAFERKSSIYNSLAASAFLLLCYNPYFLWDVGFQLSYLAIIGIVSLQKPIQNLIYFETLIPRKIWEMTSITIAAQIVTAPVCLYYFHQFPNLFLITNLIAVPLSTFILFSEIALIAFSSISVLADFISLIIGKSILFLNYLIACIDRLPYSKTEHIDVNLTSALLLYVLIFFTISGLLKRNKKHLFVSVVFLVLFSLNQLLISISRINQKFFIVYNIPHQHSIDFISGHQYHYYGDTLKYKIAIIASRKYYMTYNEDSSSTDNCSGNAIFNFYGTTIASIENKFINHGTLSVNHIDILLISKNAKVEIEEVYSALRPGIIVFDASNSLWKIEQWKKQCEALHLRYFSIPDSGAYIYSHEKNQISPYFSFL